MRADAQVLKGHLDMLLLATLENGPRHGYAVREALREASRTRFDLPTGTIYPALRRLEAAGLVQGHWSAEDGRRRRNRRDHNRGSARCNLPQSRGAFFL